MVLDIGPQSTISIHYRRSRSACSHERRQPICSTLMPTPSLTLTPWSNRRSVSNVISALRLSSPSPRVSGRKRVAPVLGLHGVIAIPHPRSSTSAVILHHQCLQFLSIIEWIHTDVYIERQTFFLGFRLLLGHYCVFACRQHLLTAEDLRP